jgi:hypothetical protein
MNPFVFAFLRIRGPKRGRHRPMGNWVRLVSESSYAEAPEVALLEAAPRGLRTRARESQRERKVVQKRTKSSKYHARNFVYDAKKEA